jgi:phosphatidate phosphatase APP1
LSRQGVICDFTGYLPSPGKRAFFVSGGNHMADWRSAFTENSDDAERLMTTQSFRLNYSLGGTGPIKLIPYRGFGQPHHLSLHGRVIEDRQFPNWEQNDQVWDNLLAIYKRLHSRHVPFAELIVRFQDIEQRITADEKGMFEVDIHPRKPLAVNRLWHPVEIELAAPLHESQSRYPVRATGQVMVPQSQAQFGVLCCIDGLIRPTDEPGLEKMAEAAFLGRSLARQAFPGMPALFQALFNGKFGSEMNPVLYVTAGPRSLYDLLVQYLDQQKFPAGPLLFLDDFRTAEDAFFKDNPTVLRSRLIRRILEFYPGLQFIMIGEDHCVDVEVFSDMIHKFPWRMKTTYICSPNTLNNRRPDAIREMARRCLGMERVLFIAEDATAIARHAAGQGYIHSRAPKAVQDEQENASQLKTGAGEARIGTFRRVPEPAGVGDYYVTQPKEALEQSVIKRRETILSDQTKV